MDIDQKLEMARDFEEWVETIDQKAAGSALGVSPPTISRQLSRVKDGGVLKARTENAFRERWELARQLEVPLSDPRLDAGPPGVGDGDGDGDGEPMITEVTDTGNSSIVESVDDGGQKEAVVEADVPPWTGMYEYVPDIVHARALTDAYEDQIYGQNLAEKIRLWRRYHEHLADIRRTRIKNAIFRLPEVRLNRIAEMEAERRVLEIELDIIANHRVALPPNNAQYDEMQRMDAVESRELRIEELDLTLSDERVSYHAAILPATLLLWWPLGAAMAIIKLIFRILTRPPVFLWRLIRRP